MIDAARITGENNLFEARRLSPAHEELSDEHTLRLETQLSAVEDELIFLLMERLTPIPAVMMDSMRLRRSAFRFDSGNSLSSLAQFSTVPTGSESARRNVTAWITSSPASRCGK